MKLLLVDTEMEDLILQSNLIKAVELSETCFCALYSNVITEQIRGFAPKIIKTVSTKQYFCIA